MKITTKILSLKHKEKSSFFYKPLTLINEICIYVYTYTEWIINRPNFLLLYTPTFVFIAFLNPNALNMEIKIRHRHIYSSNIF